MSFNHPKSQQKFSMRPTHFIFVMDTSSSMSEPAITTRNHSYSPVNSQNTRLHYTTTTLKACISVLKKTAQEMDMYNNMSPTFVSVIQFSTKAKVLLSQELSSRITEHKISDIVTELYDMENSGSTNFQEAITQVGRVSMCDDVNNIQEVVLFLTDGEVNRGVTEPDQLAHCICESINVPTSSTWKFIGVGTDFDWSLLSQIKHKFDTTPETSPQNTTISYVDNLENAHIIYGDLITPYITSSVFNVKLEDSSCSGALNNSYSSMNIASSPTYFQNQTDATLTSKSQTIPMIPDGGKIYVFMKCDGNDVSQMSLNYSETWYGNPNIHYSGIITGANVKEAIGPDSILFDIMCERQQVLELVYRSFKLVKDIENDKQHRTTPPYVPLTPYRRRSPPETHQTHQQTHQQQNRQQECECLTNELKEKLERLNEMLKAKIMAVQPSEYTDMLRQLVNDIEIANVIVSQTSRQYCSYSNRRLGMIMLNARFDSQMHQRSYTISDYSMINQEDYEDYDPYQHQAQHHHQSSTSQPSSPIAPRANINRITDFGNTISPYTPSSTRNTCNTLEQYSQL
jgi:hypothetical protein